METDTLETEDAEKISTANQKTKVFGPAMLPPLKENSETTSCVELTEPEQPQNNDEEKETDRKKNRNKRRLQQRNRKVRFQVLVAADMNMTAFRDNAQCNPSSEHPDDGGSTHIWNVSVLIQYYTEPYPRRLSSSNRRLFKLLFIRFFLNNFTVTEYQRSIW
jgi:hypothetical protein